MPATKRPKPLYQRGAYRLYPRDGRANLEIVWYDEQRGRERSASAGTAVDAEARLTLDRMYLQATGQRFCETCGRPFEGEASPLLLRAITDYLLLGQDQAGYKATRSRLSHVIEYVASKDPAIKCSQIDQAWADGFRAWLSAKPVLNAKGEFLRKRSIGHVEGCVLQLVAAINATPGQTAQFKNEQPKNVAASPKYRADVKMLAKMFRHCLYPEGRSEREIEVKRQEHAQLLAYLRAGVATWARPAEIFDLGGNQFTEEARVLDLNPPGRRQTRKYRGRIVVARQFAPFLKNLRGPYMAVGTVSGAWTLMRSKIDLTPAHGEAGPKLLRRSMATLVRKRIGEANWRQGEIWLGHVKLTISDIYALFDPANLGLALAATEEIIDEIEALCPGAFTAALPQAESAQEAENG